MFKSQIKNHRKIKINFKTFINNYKEAEEI